MRKLSLVLAAPASLFAYALRAQTIAPAFTIPQILSAPFPTGMVASPHGDAVAWVFDQAGPNNLWIARAPDWRARHRDPVTAAPQPRKPLAAASAPALLNTAGA